jgi:hypothetical protein
MRISSMNDNNTLGNVVLMIDQCKENGELKEEEYSHNLFILFGDRTGEKEYQREEGSHSLIHSHFASVLA